MIEINTIESRIRFVKGQVTTGTPFSGYVACGPGTAFPVVATLNQLSEIFFRCRNTKITGYETYQEHADYPSYYPQHYGLFDADSLPPNNYKPDDFSDGWRQNHARGMYFASASNPGWVEAHCGPTYSVNGGDYADADDELCMWPPTGVGGPIHGASHEASIFRGNAISLSPPNMYGAYNKRQMPEGSGSGGVVSYFSGIIHFSFSPIVAFVGGDSPFDTGVNLYPDMRFYDAYWGHSSIFGSASNDGSAEVVLASGTLLIPFHLLPLPGYKASLVEPPRLEVTKWWPYGKGDPLTPVWDEYTGKML